MKIKFKEHILKKIVLEEIDNVLLEHRDPKPHGHREARPDLRLFVPKPGSPLQGVFGKGSYSGRRKYASELMIKYLHSLANLHRGRYYVQDVSKKAKGKFRPHATHRQGYAVDLSLPVLRSADPGKGRANLHGHNVIKYGKRGRGLKFSNPISGKDENRKSHIDPKRAIEFLQHTLPIADVIYLDRIHIKALNNYASKPVEEGGLGWDKMKTKTFFKRVRHQPSHGNHFHVALLDVDKPKKSKIKSGWEYVPKKYKPPTGMGWAHPSDASKVAADKEQKYRDLKKLYDEHGNYIFSKRAGLSVSGEMRVRLWSEKLPKVARHPWRSQPITPDEWDPGPGFDDLLKLKKAPTPPKPAPVAAPVKPFKHEPWMEPEWRATGPPEKPKSSKLKKPLSLKEVQNIFSRINYPSIYKVCLLSKCNNEINKRRFK